MLVTRPSLNGGSGSRSWHLPDLIAFSECATRFPSAPLAYPSVQTMTNAEVFQQLATRYGYGGRLDREKRAGTPAGELFAAIAEQAEALIASARQALPRLPHIHFDFVYNRDVNAFACKENDQYFIGITSGTFVLLQLIFCRMLSDSRLLTHAGDPGGEASDLPALAGLVPDADRMAKAVGVISRPKTEPRWLYSCHLLSQAALFIIGHEIAHITRGHVDYLASKTGIPMLPEIGWNQPDPAGLMERQALEGDADQRSFLSRLSSVRSMLAAQGQSAPPWLSVPCTLEQYLFDCQFSVDLLYRLFGDISFAGSNLTAASYPPLPLRRAMLRLITLAFVQEAWGSDMKAVATAALQRSAIEVESDFAIITGECISTGGMEDAFSPEGRAHMKLLSDCWSGGLRDRLAPFAYELDPEPPGVLKAMRTS